MIVVVTQRRVRQHLVSRFYLAGFADEREQLLRVPLPGVMSHPVNCRDATVINDFYTVESPDGTLSDFFEREFEKIETPAAAALRRVVGEQSVGRWALARADKNALARWIALQHLRTEDVRAGQAQMQAQVYRLLVGVSGKEALRTHIESAEGQQVSDARLDAEWQDLTQESGTPLKADVMFHMKLLADLLPGTAAMFADMQWALTIFNRKTLITGDHPVFLEAEPSDAADMGVGLATARGFFVPLARRRALILGASPGLPDMKIPGSTGVAHAINSRTAWNARSAIYLHPQDGAMLEHLELPEKRARALVNSEMAHLISEEGLFPPGVPAPTLPPDPASRAFSLKDLPWPIPGRTFTWSE